MTTHIRKWQPGPVAHVMITVGLVVFWPIVLFAGLVRDGEWQVGNLIVSGLFHAAMWVGIAALAGWL